MKIGARFSRGLSGTTVLFKQVSLVGLCLILFVGCGPKLSRRPVRGTVTYKNQPVTNGTITFLTIGEKVHPVCGALIMDGRFAVPAAKGLEPGNYRISISMPGPPAQRTPEEIEAGASARASELIPARYNSESELTAEVRSTGENEYTLALE